MQCKFFLFVFALLAAVPARSLEKKDSDRLVDELTGTPVTGELLFRIEDLLLQPHEDDEQAVGFYSRGALLDSTALQMETKSLVKVFRYRKLHYGTREMVNLLNDAAEYVRAIHGDGDRLLVGDLGKHKGGKIPGHSSHQSGLDGDIGYYNNELWEPDPHSRRGVFHNYVVNGKVTPEFDTARNWTLIRYLVDSQMVGRIFVDKAIKDHLCKYAASKGPLDPDTTETLRRLRHWSNHSNHLHLRLACPAGSRRCVDQKEPPEGSGC